MKPRGAGFKARPSTYRLSVSPTSRARCKACKRLLNKGELRLEEFAFVMPGRRTVFVTHAACVTQVQAKNVLSVYGSADRVPAESGADAESVREARARISHGVSVACT